MRDGWKRLTLDDLLTEVSRPVRVADLEEVRYAGVRWYTEGVYARDPVPAEQVKTVTVTELRAGDVTYNRMWATKASFGVAGADVDGCHVTNDFPIFAVNEFETTASFVELLFQTRGFQSEAAAKATGTTERRRLKQRDFLTISVRIPPLDEQRRIVDLVSAVDDAIAAADGEAGMYESAARAYSRKALSEVAETCRIGDVSRIVTGRTFKAEHQGHAAGLVPYFRVSDMSLPGNERELRAPADWLDEAGIAAVKPVICPPGTVVFPILGAALATEKRRVLGIEAGFVQHMIGLIPGPRVTTGWLLAVMHGVRLADISQKGAMPSVNQSLVGNISMPLPDLGTQKRIVTDITALDDAGDAAHAAGDSLRALRSNLLTVLLSGEHEIPASYDKLLEGAVA